MNPKKKLGEDFDAFTAINVERMNGRANGVPTLA